MTQIVSFEKPGRPRIISVPPALRCTTLISVLREEPALHPFVKYLFQRGIVTLGDIDEVTNDLIQQYALDSVRQKIFFEKISSLCRPRNISATVVNLRPNP